MVLTTNIDLFSSVYCLWWWPWSYKTYYVLYKKNLRIHLQLSAYRTLYLSNQSSTKSDCYKLVHLATNCNTERHFYFSRIIHLCNCLPIIDLTCATIKAKLMNIIFWNIFLDHFNSNDPCFFHVMCPCSRCMLVPKHPNYSHFITLWVFFK